MAESKYDESFPEIAMDFATTGMTDRQIALKMDISRSSFYNYKQQYPEFAEAIEWGRELADSRVENRLLQLAMGDYTVTTNVTDDEGRTRTTVKEAAPNLKAIQLWLERSDRRKGILPETKAKKTVVQISPVPAPEETAPSVVSVVKTPPTPELDPSETAGLQALAEYMAMCPADAGDGFSKKETQEFEDMMLITFTEMERRKYNEKAIAEGRPQIPHTDAAPRTVKGKYAPDMIKAWKDRAELFELAV